jgi:hypothetical protein
MNRNEMITLLFNIQEVPDYGGVPTPLDKGIELQN